VGSIKSALIFGIFTAQIDAYIKKPSEFMKGNRMSFVGIKKAEDREAVLLYMKSKTTPQ